MSTKNLSTVATQVIEASGMAATNVINSYRFGGERVIGYFDERFASAVTRGASSLGKSTRSSLIDNQQRVSGFYVKGLRLGTDRAQSAVGVAVDLATKGVSLVATNAKRLDSRVNLNALDKLTRVAMPAASLLSSVAERLEEGTTELVKRVAGKTMPAKAVATRKLNASKRKATAIRRQVTKAASQQVDQAVTARKKITKTATEQVDKVVATRKQITKRVSKAVANTATQTSNAARRVARKTESAASAA
jgi:ketosteroid isomerase-like protein